MPGYSVTYSVVDNATKQIEAINRRIQQMTAPLERMAKQAQRFVDVSGLQKIAAGFENIARAAFNSFVSMSRMIPPLAAITGAASIAGVVALTKSFSQLGVSIQGAADRAQISAQQMQLWRNAARAAGGSADDMTTALEGVHDAAARAFTGRDVDAIQWYRNLGIAYTGADGKLRDTSELFRELVPAIAQSNDYFDRHTKAVALGGEGLARMVEMFRRAGKPIDEFLRQQERLVALSPQQIESQRRFNQALGSLENTFESLGLQISATIARDLSPLLERFNEFVVTHQPQIIAAVDNISRKFAAWLEHVDWSKVAEGVTALGAGLVSIATHLDDVARIAEIVAGIFVAKWGIQAVASVVALTQAIGIGAVGGVGGTGLLGALGAVGAAAAAILGTAYGLEKLIEALPRGTPPPGTRPGSRGNVPTGVVPPPAIPAPGPGPNLGRGLRVPGGAAAELTPGQQEAISRAEGTYGPGGINYNTLYGGGTAPLTDMTIADVAKLGGPAFGGFQIHRVHLEPGSDTLKTLGIDPNTTKFTPEVQGRIANYIHRRQGTGAWTGFQQHPEELQRFNQAMPAAPAVPAAPNAAGGAYGVPGAVMNYGGTGALGAPGTNLTTIKAPGGQSVTVNKAAAEAFSGFLSDLSAVGYPISSIGGYNMREKRGGSGWSEHAYGTAIDINPDRNPFMSGKTDLPANIHDIAAKWGLVWGGDWTNPKDPMHFQWGGPAAGLLASQGKPAQVTGGPAVTGSVDVNITHTNPPRGVTLTATGTGMANVGEVRTEQQQMTGP